MRKLNLESKRKALEAQIAALKAELAAGTAEIKKISEKEKERHRRYLEERKEIARIRKADRNSKRGGLK
jgi:hypothetical protein